MDDFWPLPPELQSLDTDGNYHGIDYVEPQMPLDGTHNEAIPEIAEMSYAPIAPELALGENSFHNTWEEFGNSTSLELSMLEPFDIFHDSCSATEGGVDMDDQFPGVLMEPLHEIHSNPFEGDMIRSPQNTHTSLDHSVDVVQLHNADTIPVFNNISHSIPAELLTPSSVALNSPRPLAPKQLGPTSGPVQIQKVGRGGGRNALRKKEKWRFAKPGRESMGSCIRCRFSKRRVSSPGK